MISRSIISLRSSIIVIIITINIVVVVVVVSAHRRENNAFFHSNVRNFAFRTILGGYVFGQKHFFGSILLLPSNISIFEFDT